ncbi:MAG: condensation domain-containing protein, partial [candidate division NC10 bacterium]
MAVPGKGSEPRVTSEEEDPVEALFDALLRTETSTETSLPEPASKSTLSSLQERLWLVHQLDPGNAAYVMPCHLRLHGKLDTSALKAALQFLWQRHDALRTVFPSRHGQPARVVLPAEALAIFEHDLSEAADPEAWKGHYLAFHAGPFKLEAGPLFRVCLYRVAPEEHLLLIDIHHINTDGASLDILRGELFEVYRAFLAGRRPALPALGASYADFIEDEAARRESPDYAQALEKRVKELAGAPMRLAFPFDKPIPGTFSHRGGSLFRQYKDLSLLRQAFACGRGEGLTPFMVVLAAYGTLLHLLTGQEDLLIGIPTSLRQSDRFERTVGFFVNTCVARLDFGGRPNLRQIMRRTRLAVREMINCVEAPLDYLVRALHDRRTPDRPPLIQAALSFLVAEVSTPSEDLTIEPAYQSRDSAMFELTMDLILQGDRGICHMEYYAEAWEKPSIGRMIDHFHAILEAMVRRPDYPAAKINLASPQELRELADVLDSQPLERSIRLVPDWIGEHARCKPQDIAIQGGGTPTSYSQLDERVALRRGQLVALGLNVGA